MKDRFPNNENPFYKTWFKNLMEEDYLKITTILKPVLVFKTSYICLDNLEEPISINYASNYTCLEYIYKLIINCANTRIYLCASNKNLNSCKHAHISTYAMWNTR